MVTWPSPVYRAARRMISQNISFRYWRLNTSCKFVIRLIFYREMCGEQLTQQQVGGLVLISNVPFSSLFRSPRLLSSSTSYRLILLSSSSFLSWFGHTPLENIFFELYVLLRYFYRYMTRKWFLVRLYQSNYVGW